MADLPLREEMVRAIGKMKSGKMGGSTSILPEMVKVASCDDEFLSAMLELVHDVWRRGTSLSVITGEV